MLNFETTDEIAELFKEVRKINKNYSFYDVVGSISELSRTMSQRSFILAWREIPDNYLYETYKNIFSDVSSDCYMQMFDPALLSKIRGVNKHDTVRNPIFLNRIGSDGKLTIYHGHVKKSLRGSNSWTMEPKIAHFFGCRNANRHHAEDYYVVAGKVNPEDIIAYITDRSECEVVILNKQVHEKNKEWFSFSKMNKTIGSFDDVKVLIAQREAYSNPNLVAK